MTHVERHYPKDEEDLQRLVQSVVKAQEPIVAQAGHFLLFLDEARQAVKACIANPEGPENDPILDNFGHFPLLTWDLGLRILHRTNSREKRILLLVNDWQYLPEAANRRDFYVNNPDFPHSFQTRLSQFPGIELLVPQIATDEVVTGSYFGEMHLRNRYKKRIARMIRSASLPGDATLSDDGHHLTCTIPLSGGQSTEIYCSGKSADCAAEVAELLLQISTTFPGSVFLNIYPIVCRDFVDNGTILASRLEGFRLPTVINVGLQSSRISTAQDLFAGCEMSIFRFS